MDQPATPQLSERVFVSYTHDDNPHSEKVLSFCNELCSLFVDCNCDQYIDDGNPNFGWPRWMSENVRESKFVLVVCSKKYLDRAEGREDAGKGQGGKWEAFLSESEIYHNDGGNMKFIPVLFTEADKGFIPGYLKPFTHYTVSDEGSFKELVLRVRGEMKSKRPMFGAPTDTSYRKSNSGSSANNTVTTTLPLLPEFTYNMKPGIKILQTFLALPFHLRFNIANELELVNDGENYMAQNPDELSNNFLIRAKEQNKLSQLWDKLFPNVDIDPNPFKN